MMLKNVYRIISSYRFSIITIIFFELLYLIKGYKGNNFSFSDNNSMADNLPCPYYFLFKIKKTLKNNNFSNFIDLGCGSGRTIGFFNKNFYNKNFIGIEYFPDQYEYCRNIFQSKNNIKIIQADFTKTDFFQYDSDCYFFNNPFKNSSEFVEFMEKTTNFYLNKKNVLFIFVNFNKKIIENLENIRCIESHYISEIKGYSICCLDK
jgi:SAM-dependent methyltransferase